jgi:hypothetical protein
MAWKRDKAFRRADRQSFFASSFIMNEYQKRIQNPERNLWINPLTEVFLTAVTITSDRAHQKLSFMELNCLRNPAREKTN